jgi:cell division ATPase FtsA
MLPGEEIHVLPQEFKIDQSEKAYLCRVWKIRPSIHKKCRTMHPKFRIELSGLTLEPLASSDVLSQEEKEAGVAN